MKKVQVYPADGMVLPVDVPTVTAVREYVAQHTPEGGRNVTIFAAAAEPRSPAHAQAARELGTRIGVTHNVVWGGTNAGLMSEISTAARNSGAYLIGVAYASGAEMSDSPIDFMFGAQSLMERKKGLIALGDVALALPGGLGTFDEVATYMERKKAGRRLPPLVLLNTDGFYDGLRAQVERIEAEGMSRIPGGQLAVFPETLEEAVTLLSSLQPPETKQA